MLNYLRFISLILFLAGANSMVFGQCTTVQLAAIPLSPATTFIPQCNLPKVITSSGTTNQYSNVSVVAGYQYNFRSVNQAPLSAPTQPYAVGSAATNDFITIANGTAPLFSGLNGSSGIYWTATLTGTIRFYTHTSAGCITTGTQPARKREVIMAPFQASISKVNSCTGSPTGQYTVTVGPNHGWNSTSIVPPLNECNTLIAGNTTTGAALPLSYNIMYNGTSVNSGTGGSSSTNAEICPLCPGSVTTGTSTWSGTSTLTSPFTGFAYLSTTSPFPAFSYLYPASNSGPVGTYTSPANILGSNSSNKAILVWPSGTTTPLISAQLSTSLYQNGCGAYHFYPTIGIDSPVNPNFANIAAICSGATAPVLPTSSTNTPPITGTWSPAVSNTATTLYTFTPAVGQCASATTMTITVTPNVTPAVSIAALPLGPICAGTPVTFTATPTNGGTTPTYQWMLNGTTNVGTGSTTYTNPS